MSQVHLSTIKVMQINNEPYLVAAVTSIHLEDWIYQNKIDASKVTYGMIAFMPDLHFLVTDIYKINDYEDVESFAKDFHVDILVTESQATDYQSRMVENDKPGMFDPCDTRTIAEIYGAENVEEYQKQRDEREEQATAAAMARLEQEMGITTSSFDEPEDDDDFYRTGAKSIASKDADGNTVIDVNARYFAGGEDRQVEEKKYDTGEHPSTFNATLTWHWRDGAKFYDRTERVIWWGRKIYGADDLIHEFYTIGDAGIGRSDPKITVKLDDGTNESPACHDAILNMFISDFDRGDPQITIDLSKDTDEDSEE